MVYLMGILYRYLQGTPGENKYIFILTSKEEKKLKLIIYKK